MLDPAHELSPDIAEPVTLRVVSWNLNHWRQPLRPVDTRAAAWDYLGRDLRADVALLQETVPPASADQSKVVYREIADYRPWGSAVAAFRDGLRAKELWAVRTPYSRRRFTLANTFPGSVAVAEVAIPEVAPITFVSLYNVIDVYAQTTLLRIVADLIPLFDSAQGARVVLGGDLNVALSTTDPYYLRRGQGILGALESLGLVEARDVARERPAGRPDCPCGANGDCAHIPTWKGSELDHIYVSESLKQQVLRVAVDQSPVGRLSDHAPLILDLELTHEPVAREWDRDTFAAEVDRLQGPAARHAVEELYRWAEDKELQLRARGIRDVDLTRFPTSRGPSAELWFQIDYQGPVPALMYTISIRASGQVVVQFQWMRQPPFDTPEGREGLRQSLNTIDGIQLAADRLGGRPMFPLSVLEDEAAREAVMRVLDEIVDRTRPSGGPIIEPGLESRADVLG